MVHIMCGYSDNLYLFCSSSSFFPDPDPDGAAAVLDDPLEPPYTDS
jgi:hypothetical protein